MTRRARRDFVKAPHNTMESAMLRPTVPADTPELKRLTAATGFFKPHVIDTLEEVLDDYHAENEADGHVCQTLECDGQPQGFAYFAPAPMTLGTWELWWIVVKKDVQGRGLGGKMLKFVEADLRRRKGRVLFVETSSQPLYEPTRRFYLKHGYEQHAVLKDYYAAGDSMVIFRKEM
jgi:ribosomal protein S18 acetylase RimI-like enzyme